MDGNHQERLQMKRETNEQIERSVSRDFATRTRKSPDPSHTHSPVNITMRTWLVWRYSSHGYTASLDWFQLPLQTSPGQNGDQIDAPSAVYRLIRGAGARQCAAGEEIEGELFFSQPALWSLLAAHF